MSTTIKERMSMTIPTRKKSRRFTEDKIKSLEIGNDDCVRFPLLLQKSCEERLYLCLPVIKTFQIREDGLLSINTPKLYYGFEVLTEIVVKLLFNKEMKLKMVECNANEIIDSRLFYCLSVTMLYFSESLTTLKLDYCNLQANHLRTLQDNLNSKKTITELSICGNPNQEQNFFCLLHCGLKVLILKFCQINLEGLKKLAREYLNTPPYSSSLIHLDLSHNMIFDEGCKYITNILRCDRNLLSINLTDCKIGDEGFKHLLSVFLQFPLNVEELYLRRKLRMEFYKLTYQSKLPTFCDSKTELPLTEADIKDKLATIEAILGQHPFIVDSYEENGEIICKGNYTLNHFNIAYNPLSQQSLKLLVKTLMEQTLLFGAEKGLNRIVLEGTSSNQHECEDVKNTIYDLLVSKRMRTGCFGSNESTTIQSRSSLRRNMRKASSGASSIRSGQLSSREKESVTTTA